MLLFRLSGVFLWRLAERAFLELLFHEPPRNTRYPRVPRQAAQETESPVRPKSVELRMSVRKRRESANEACPFQLAMRWPMAAADHSH